MVEKSTKKKAGRPPSEATLHMRALIASMPDYAKAPTNKSAEKSSDSVIGLSEANFAASWKLIRKSYGLHHKAIPDSLVLDVLAMKEGPDPECEQRNPIAPPYAEIQKRTTENLESKLNQIATNAKKSGQKNARAQTLLILIETKAPETLKKLAKGEISYKEARKELADSKLPVPAERSLRRMVRNKTGQEPAPK